LKGFVVEKFSNSLGKWEAVAKSDKEEALVEGLSQTESYKFRVALESDDGVMGKFAESEMVSTSLTSPTKFSNELKGLFLLYLLTCITLYMFLVKSPPITNLEVSHTEDGFQLQWDPPAAYSKYKVEVCELKDGQIGEWRECANVDDCSVTIRDLPSSSSYRFRVRAANRQGISEPVESDEWMSLSGGESFLNKRAFKC
jgi:hypothetical protein